MWKVWVFLAPLCPICQDYTFYLNALNEQWEEEYPGQVEMVGWFPNPTVTDEQIATFADRYDVDWSLAKDTSGWSDAVEAKWTPEAFLIDPNGQVRYRGRVNDLYYALGKHRAKPKRQDLALAVEQAMDGQAVDPKRKDAIGCPIERRILARD
jgi:hypothetical protein